MGVVRERQLRHAIRPADGAVGRLHLPHGNAPCQRAGVARHAVVGNLHVVVPAVHEDPAAALRAVRERDAVDARRIAQEVARIRVAVRRAVGQRRADAVGRAVRIGLQAIRARHVAHALPEHGDGRALIRPHQRRLHQQLGQIAVEVRIPANRGLERNRIDLALHRRRAAVRALAARIERMARGDQATIERHAKQAVGLRTPCVHLAGRMRGGVDDDRRRPHALQPHGLPHQQHLSVAARPDDDHVTRHGGVQRRLDRVARRVFAVHIGRRLAADRDGDRIDRLLAVGRGHDQLAAEGLRLPCLLDRAARLRRAQGRDQHLELGVAPRGDRCPHAADRDRARAASRPETVMALDELLVERRRRRGRPGIAAVRHDLVSQRVDRQGVQRCAHPGSAAASRQGITQHGGDRRRGIGIRAIRRVVSGRKRLHGHDRGVHVLRLAGHERDLVAELAVGRVVQRIADGLAGMRRVGHVRIVHAGDHHGRRVAGRVRRVDLPGRVVQAVEDAPLVRIQPRDLVAGKVLHRDRHIRHREFLAELRRIRVELRREVIQHEAGEVRSDVCRAEQVELRQHRHLIVEPHLLAIAQAARCPGKRRHFLRAREQAQVVRHDPQVTRARPEGLGHAGVALAARERHGTEMRRGVLRVVGVVGRVHRGLVRQDVNVAQTGKLLRYGGDEVVADQDVLVFLLHQFVARRHDHFDHVLSGWQHHRAVAGRIGSADRRVTVRAGRLAGARVAAGHARELVHPIVWRGLQLVEHVHAVVALELCVARQCALLRIKPLRRVLQREEERIGCFLPRAVHVRDAVGAEALRPIVPTGRLGGIHELERRGAVRGGGLLIQVDRDVRDVRYPPHVHRERGVVECARRRVGHFAADTAVLIGRECLLAELDERILPREALPTHRRHPWRIDTAGRRAGARAILAVRVIAVDRSRHPQVGRQMGGA